MGSFDISPAHVPSHVVPICGLLLQIGGGLWTISYIFYIRESVRSQSYGMPLFALAINFGWEVVYALYVSEAPIEKTVFAIWLIMDCGMVYGMMKYAKYEWSHAPKIANWIVPIFAVMVVGTTLGHWTFAKWWLENDIGKRDGKFYRGVIGPDVTELGFWSAGVSQIYLSAASLCQLVVRQHSGGVSWAVWGTRSLGSVVGFCLCFGWGWYFWREAHEYFMSPFGIFLWVTGLVCDCIYPYALWRIKKTEKVLTNGRKVDGSKYDTQEKVKRRQ